MRQIKIVSDGTPYNTKVLDQDGKEIQGISRISWEIGVNELAVVSLEFSNVAVEVLGLSEVPSIDTEDGTPV